MTRIDRMLGWTVVVLALLLAAAGCGGGEPPADALTEAELQQATSIYAAQVCGMCHGEQAEGTENGPALRKLAPYWTVDRIVEYLNDPDAFREVNPDFDARRTTEYEMPMPAYEHVNAGGRRVLARWLLTR